MRILAVFEEPKSLSDGHDLVVQVWEYAFRDHVTALEGQAEDDMVRLNMSFLRDRDGSGRYGPQGGRDKPGGASLERGTGFR